VEQVTTHTVKVFLSASGLGSKAGSALALVEKALEDDHQVLVHVEELDDYLAIAGLLLASPGAGRIHILHVPHQRYSRTMCSLVDQRLTLETCPHYLLWEWTWSRQGCDVNPPVVPADLWSEIREGRINTVGTDHCSYRLQDKEMHGLPGFPGLETLLPIVFTYGVEAGRISWGDLCRILSAGPARVLGLYPQKGTIQTGSDADLVIFDLDHQDVVGAPRYGRGDFSPFCGLNVKGKVVSTLVRGRQVYADGKADLGATGWGTWQESGRAAS
jgi:dihydroorotase-like cyclic amidohydrolase